MKRLPLLLALCLACGIAQAGAMKKCVDASGKVLYYGDTIPPDLLPRCKSTAELSRKGTEQKKTEYLTADERRAREESDAAQKQDLQKEAEQKRKDRALLATYTSEKEIELAKQRNLKPLDQQIAIHQEDLKRAKGPDAQRIQTQIDQKQKERAAIASRFEADKARFRELRGLPSPTPPAAPQAPTAPIAPAKK